MDSLVQNQSAYIDETQTKTTSQMAQTANVLLYCAAMKYSCKN